MSPRKLGAGIDAFVGFALSSATVFAQVQWTEITVAPTPPLRSGAVIAYDSARDRIVVFGGADATSQLADTWEWDGTQWLQRTPAHVPAARYNADMVFDSARGVCVLFGGRNRSGTRYSDTWEWNGVDWTARSFATRPAARNSHAMTYDSARGRVVLHGGTPDGASETWEYDGVAWSRRSASGGPDVRYNHGMAFDAARGRTVLFGGTNSAGNLTNDTWEWNGTSWSVRAPANRPSIRGYLQMAFDVSRARVVLFGGSNLSTYFADTWEFDGVDWAQRTTATSPTARADHSVVHDGLRRVTLMGFGAFADSNLWEYRPIDPAEYSLLGSGCAGSAGVPTISNSDLGPFANDVFTIQIANVPAPAAGAAVGLLGFRDDAWGPLLLPAELTDIGMPGCTLRNDLGAVWVLPVIGNVATWDLLIPATEPPLFGLRFFQQALCLDAAANAAGMTLSDQGRGVVGGR
ncbi:MAG: hypothetical protein HZB39_00125 [Planctomycetes bacterium]|nr:hypothetical protein [Planctomycetota bacterium]